MSAREPVVRPAHAELPMTRPLNTEVMAKDTPVTVPTMPLARSRRSSGTRRVTQVDRAMPRIWPATEPEQRRPRRAPRTTGCAGGGDPAPSTARKTRVATAKQAADTRGQHHRLVLAVVVDVGAEERAEHRRGDAEGAADHPGRHHRPGLEVHPERQGEPQERVDQQAVEHAHRWTDATGGPNSSMRGRSPAWGSSTARWPSSPARRAASARRRPAAVRASAPRRRQLRLVGRSGRGGRRGAAHRVHLRAGRHQRRGTGPGADRPHDRALRAARRARQQRRLDDVVPHATSTRSPTTSCAGPSRSTCSAPGG